MGTNGILKKLPTGMALLTAGVRHHPDTQISLSAHLNAAALSNFPVDDHLLPYALPAAIIRRRYGRIKPEPKDYISVVAKSFNEHKRLGRQIPLLGQHQNSSFDSQHSSVKPVFGRRQFSSSSVLTWLLSCGRGTQLEKTWVFPAPPEYAVV
jgi:hypothetical protein